MKIQKYILTILIALTSFVVKCQEVTQNFDESINQVGCWEYTNMAIDTKNTINSSNRKKALVGLSGVGSPAHSFSSPILTLNGTGVITFSHKLTTTAGFDRELVVYLLDRAEHVIQVIHTHTYIQSGGWPNGAPTTVFNVSIPVTWTGDYIVHWEWSGTGTGGVGVIDEILINGTDLSDGSNDNGYGYCRPDDFVVDTVCANSSKLYLLPYPIQKSTWSWTFGAGPTVGSIDTTWIPNLKDTIVAVSWLNVPGTYSMEATEIRPPHNTTTYSVRYSITVLPLPSVIIVGDTVCIDEVPTLTFTFTGTAPWTVSYTDGSNSYSNTFNSATATVNLPAYQNNVTISVTALSDASICPSDPAAFPSTSVIVLPDPTTGPVYHY